MEGISIPVSVAIVDATIQDGMSGNPGKVGSDGSVAGLNAGTPEKVGMVKPPAGKVGIAAITGKVGMDQDCAEAPATTAAAATAAAMEPEVLRGAMGLRGGFGGCSAPACPRSTP